MRRDPVWMAALVALALGGGAKAQLDCPRRWEAWEPQRNVVTYVKGVPGQPVHTLHVAAEVATDLMFPSEVDPARTRLSGGEGRFEPLMISGRSVVVVPLHDLAEGERFSLVVTLKDGASMPFDLAAPGRNDPTDGQVDVHLDRENPVAIRQSLEHVRTRAATLTAENERLVREETSVDHAIAALLVQGRSDLTQFTEAETSGIHDVEADIRVITFKPRLKGDDPGKAVVLFRVTNQDPQASWELDEVRLQSATSLDAKPFAFRAAATTIGPGKTEAMAVVIDAEAFGPNRADHLVLEIWRRAPGRARQATVELVMVDDKALRIPLQRGKTR